MASFASKRFCNFPFSSESNQIEILIKFSYRFLAVLTKEFSFQKVFLFEHLCSFFINGYVTLGAVPFFHGAFMSVSILRFILMKFYTPHFNINISLPID